MALPIAAAGVSLLRFIIVGIVSGIARACTEDIIKERKKEEPKNIPPDVPKKEDVPYQEPKSPEIIVAFKSRLNNKAQNLLNNDREIKNLLKNNRSIVGDIEREGRILPYEAQQIRFVRELERLMRRKLEPEVNRFMKSNNLRSNRQFGGLFNS